VASKNRIINLFHKAGFTKIDTQIEAKYATTKPASSKAALSHSRQRDAQ